MYNFIIICLKRHNDSDEKNNDLVGFPNLLNKQFHKFDFKK